MSSDDYRRVASAVRYTCEELARELRDAQYDPAPAVRLLRGESTTCYGIVSARDPSRYGFVSARLQGSRLVLVVGRLVGDAGRQRVELQQVPIEGPLLVPALARVQRALKWARYVCTCGHDLPIYPADFPDRGQYVCPA